MGMLDGKVAFITGAARGQGRSHAVRLAQEGADIIAVDLAAQPETVKIPGATVEDLAETARQVEALDRRIITQVVDIRDVDALSQAVTEGVAELGHLDIVLGNAGIWALDLDEPTDRASRQKIWRETVDVNLTGQFNVLEATVPILLEQGTGGAIVLTSSSAGLKSMGIGSLAQTAYTAAKHGVVGLMRNYAVELAPHNIRVNTVHPGGIATPMTQNPIVEGYVNARPELAGLMATLLPIPLLEPVDISNGILYLVSDMGRYVTGVTLPIDAGFLAK